MGKRRDWRSRLRGHKGIPLAWRFGRFGNGTAGLSAANLDQAPGTRLGAHRLKLVRRLRADFAPAEACLRQAGLCYWVVVAGSVAARCVRIKAATKSYRAGLVQTS